MIRFIPSSLFSVLALMALVFVSCSQADEPVPVEQAGDDEMRIYVSVPSLSEFPSVTRSSGMSLRYVARLYKGNYPVASELVARQEETALNSGKIIFKGEPGTYTVTIFADYIPSSSTKDANGRYPDYYFNTQGRDDEITMMTLKDPSNGKTYANSNINNPDVECFAWKQTFVKGTDAYEATSPLKRLVGKVRFVAEGGNVSNIDKIKIKEFAYHSIYSFAVGKSGTQTYYQSNDGKPASFEFTPNDPSSGELFYFYTFGGLANEDAIRTISFEITGKDGSSYKPVTTEGKRIVPKANRVTTIKGNFAAPTSSASNEMRFTVSQSLEWDGEDNIN